MSNHGPGTCDPECVKILIDTGMRLAAKFFSAILATINLTTPLKPSFLHAPMFYLESVELFEGVALMMNRDYHLTDDQRGRLMAQVDKTCYRADKLIAWGLMSADVIVSKQDAWTADMLEWAKDDQTFYTKLAKELKKKE